MARGHLLRLAVLLLAAGALASCAARYTLVPAGQTSVSRQTFSVTPSRAWNRLPRVSGQVRAQENWTASGPVLDSLSFIGGIAAGETIAEQRERETQRVPLFQPDMTPPDLASMIESFYRIKAGAVQFDSTGVRPRPFLGASGLQFDYDYVDAADVKRRGRTVMAVIDDRLYMMTLDGARIHYFDAALPEFEAMANGASLSD